MITIRHFFWISCWLIFLIWGYISIFSYFWMLSDKTTFMVCSLLCSSALSILSSIFPGLDDTAACNMLRIYQISGAPCIPVTERKTCRKNMAKFTMYSCASICCWSEIISGRSSVNQIWMKNESELISPHPKMNKHGLELNITLVQITL